MSWGYWGIVIGVLALQMVFFISLAIAYPRKRGAWESLEQRSPQNDREAAFQTTEKRKAG